MRRRLGWQPVNDHRSVCPKRWLLVREDVAKCAANLIAICTVVLRQTWQYGVNRRCVPPFFFVHYPLVMACVQGVWAQRAGVGREWLSTPRLYFEICSIVHMAQTDSTEKERMRVGGKRKPGKRSRPQEHEAWRLRMRAVMYNGVASIVCVVCRRLVTGLREASCICCSWLPGVCVSVNLA